MFCIVSAIVLSILGIFSASNRALAREAFDCVLRRVTFRPCTTGFDEKMKAKILGAVIMRSERLAAFISKYFEILAWSFFVIFLAAGVMFFRGLYLFYVTGSCNGLNQSAFCVFDPTGANNQVSSLTEGCQVTPTTAKDLTLKGVNLDGFPVYNPQMSERIVMIGCYSCDYTRKTYPKIMELVKRYNISLVFLHYPVKEKSDLLHRVGYCAYQQDPEKYWPLNDILFKADKSKFELPAMVETSSSSLGSMESSAPVNIDSNEFLKTTLGGLGYDIEKINACVNDPATEAAVQKQMDEVVKTHFYGTPTIFVGDQVFVGPKPDRVYAIAMRGLFFWLR